MSGIRIDLDFSQIRTNLIWLLLAGDLWVSKSEGLLCFLFTGSEKANTTRLVVRHQASNKVSHDWNGKETERKSLNRQCAWHSLTKMYIRKVWFQIKKINQIPIGGASYLCTVFRCLRLYGLSFSSPASSTSSPSSSSSSSSASSSSSSPWESESQKCAVQTSDKHSTL